MFGLAALFFLALVLVTVASAAQTAFGFLNAARLRRLMQRGATRSQALSEVAHNPGPFLSSVALLHTSAIAGATAVTLSAALDLTSDPWLRLSLGFGALLLLLLAQTLGRGVANLKAEWVAESLYAPLHVIGLVTVPLVSPGHFLVDTMLRRLLGVQQGDRLTTTEEDLRILVDAVEETEGLEEGERDMINSIFELSDREVSEIMIPRLDVIAIEDAVSVEEALDLLISTGHSRFPVFEEDLDHILGLVHLRDLTRALRAGSGLARVAGFVRPVHFVPESKKFDELLQEFQTQHIQMAVVADEYGGTAGLVTIEDLIEEIVGEIHDEYDVDEEARITPVSDHEAIMDARVSIHDVNEVLDLNLDDEEYDTLGGLVYDRLAKIPSVGDVVELENGTIVVLSTKGRRIGRLRVTLAD